MDVTYTGTDFFPYLLNIVSFNDEAWMYNAVARLLCSKQNCETYAKSINMTFQKVTVDHARFSNGKKDPSWLTLMMDNTKDCSSVRAKTFPRK